MVGCYMADCFLFVMYSDNVMERHASIELFVKELRRYIDLRVQRMRIVLVQKFVYLLAILVFACILAVFGVIAICYLSYSFVHLLQIYVGASVAYFVVAVLMLLVVALFYWQRRCWLLDPIARVMTRILIDDDE